jgi:hypothetical protein
VPGMPLLHILLLPCSQEPEEDGKWIRQLLWLDNSLTPVTLFGLQQYQPLVCTLSAEFKFRFISSSQNFKEM